MSHKEPMHGTLCEPTTGGKMVVKLFLFLSLILGDKDKPIKEELQLNEFWRNLTMMVKGTLRSKISQLELVELSTHLLTVVMIACRVIE